MVRGSVPDRVGSLRPRPVAPLRRLAAVGLGLVLALLAGASPHAGTTVRSADDAWEIVREDPDLRVERRPGRRSACDEVRVTRRVDVVPEVALDVLWEVRDERPYVDDLVESRILRESADERLVYGRLEVPLVRDRVYVVRVTRHVDETSGARELRFSLANDEPLPGAKRSVRVAVLEGAWHIEPVAGTPASRIEYRAEVDPGEGIPAWVASRLQRQRAVKVVERYARRMSERAARLTASVARD